MRVGKCTRGSLDTYCFFSQRPQFSKNPISRVFFFDANSVIRRGARCGFCSFMVLIFPSQTLTIQDLWQLNKANQTKTVEHRVRKLWSEELKREQPWLLRVRPILDHTVSFLLKALVRLAPGVFTGAIVLCFLNSANIFGTILFTDVLVLMQLVPVILLPFFISWLTYDPSYYEVHYDLLLW